MLATAPAVSCAPTARVVAATGTLVALAVRDARPLARTAAPGALARELSSRLGPWRLPFAIHDPGKIVLDLAVALGGDAACDVALLRAQPGVFGLVASDPRLSLIHISEPTRPY